METDRSRSLEESQTEATEQPAPNGWLSRLNRAIRTRVGAASITLAAATAVVVTTPEARAEISMTDDELVKHLEEFFEISGKFKVFTGPKLTAENGLDRVETPNQLAKIALSKIKNLKENYYYIEEAKQRKLKIADKAEAAYQEQLQKWRAILAKKAGSSTSSFGDISNADIAQKICDVLKVCEQPKHMGLKHVGGEFKCSNPDADRYTIGRSETSGKSASEAKPPLKSDPFNENKETREAREEAQKGKRELSNIGGYIAEAKARDLTAIKTECSSKIGSLYSTYSLGETAQSKYDEKEKAFEMAIAKPEFSVDELKKWLAKDIKSQCFPEPGDYKFKHFAAFEDGKFKTLQVDLKIPADKILPDGSHVVPPPQISFQEESTFPADDQESLYGQIHDNGCGFYQGQAKWVTWNAQIMKDYGVDISILELPPGATEEKIDFSKLSGQKNYDFYEPKSVDASLHDLHDALAYYTTPELDLVHKSKFKKIFIVDAISHNIAGSAGTNSMVLTTHNIGSFYHEMFHVLDFMDDLEKNDDTQWITYNPHGLRDYTFSSGYEAAIKDGKCETDQPQGFAACYAMQGGPNEDQAVTGEMLWHKENGRTMLIRTKKDPVLLKKVEAITGCTFDQTLGRFSSDMSVQEYKTRSGYTSFEYYAKWFRDAKGNLLYGADFWNKKLDLTDPAYMKSYQDKL